MKPPIRTYIKVTILSTETSRIAYEFNKVRRVERKKRKGRKGEVEYCARLVGCKG